MVTGLSDEEDAVRHLAQRFNQDLIRCINCETWTTRGDGHWCREMEATVRGWSRKRK